MGNFQSEVSIPLSYSLQKSRTLEVGTCHPGSHDHKRLNYLKWPSHVPFANRLVEGSLVKGFSCSLSFGTPLHMLQCTLQGLKKSHLEFAQCLCTMQIMLCMRVADRHTDASANLHKCCHFCCIWETLTLNSNHSKSGTKQSCSFEPRATRNISSAQNTPQH